MVIKIFHFIFTAFCKNTVCYSPPPRSTTATANAFALLDNTTTLKFVAKYNSSLVQYADYPFKAPLPNPCNPLTSIEASKQKPPFPVNKHWLGEGKSKTAHLQKKIQDAKLKNTEQQWFDHHAIPRLTFAWSLYALANITQHIPRENWLMTRKHEVSHALIRTIAHQHTMDLTMRIQYLNNTQIIAEKPLEQLHVLLINTVHAGFIPSLIFNPPQHLIEVHATSTGGILQFWAELVWSPDVICCDSEKYILFSPYLLPNAFPLKNITNMGILPVIGPFAPPENFSLQAKEIFQQEWQNFLKHCHAFIKNEPLPPVYYPKIKNEL